MDRKKNIAPGVIAETKVRVTNTHKPREETVEQTPQGLSKNARRLLKHADNNVGHFVTQMLLRRNQIAKSLCQSDQDVDLSSYQTAAKVASTMEKIPVPMVSQGASLAATFIKQLENSQSQYQLWLASFYRSLKLSDKEFEVFANLFGSHIDEKYTESIILDPAVARKIASKCVLRFDVMLMNWSPSCLGSFMADSLPSPDWVPEELRLSKPSQHKIDSIYRFAKESIKPETRISDTAVQKLTTGILSWFDSSEKAAQAIEESPVHIQSLCDSESPLKLFIIKPHSIPGIKGINSILPDEKFSLSDYRFGQALRLTTRSRPPVDALELTEVQVKRVVSHWLSQRVFELLKVNRFFDERNNRTFQPSSSEQIKFIAFFNQFINSEPLQSRFETNILGSLFGPQSVPREFNPRIVNVAKLFYKNCAKMYAYDRLRSKKQFIPKNKGVVLALDKNLSDPANQKLVRMWTRVVEAAVRLDSNAIRADILKSKRTTFASPPNAVTVPVAIDQYERKSQLNL